MGAVFSYSFKTPPSACQRNMFQSLMGAVFSYSDTSASDELTFDMFQSLMGAVFSYSQRRRKRHIRKAGFNP